MEIKLEPEVTSFEVEIRGVKPMLMHGPAGAAAPKKGRGSQRSDEEEIELCLYKNEAGEIVFPGRNIIACIKGAASDFKMGGKGKKTFKGYVESGLEITPEEPLLIHNGFEKDVRIARVQQARIPRVRPIFNEWGLKFTLNVIDPLLIDANKTGVILKEMLESAGKHQGLGDYRPLFGRFEVTKFEKI